MDEIKNQKLMLECHKEAFKMELLNKSKKELTVQMENQQKDAIIQEKRDSRDILQVRKEQAKYERELSALKNEIERRRQAIVESRLEGDLNVARGTLEIDVKNILIDSLKTMIEDTKTTVDSIRREATAIDEITEISKQVATT